MSSPSAAAMWPPAVVFDLDGTLADSFAAIAEALDTALAEFGRPRLGVGWATRHVGRGAEALVRDALAGEPDPERVRAFGRRFGEIYRAIYLAATPPMSEALDTVTLVSSVTAGRVAVVSNKSGELCAGWLERYGFAPFVAVISGPDRSGVRKPDPGAVLPALRQIGAEPSQTLLVGDMEVDRLTAASAGLTFVAVRSAASEPELGRHEPCAAVLDGVRELPGWLAAHGEGWPRSGSAHPATGRG